MKMYEAHYETNWQDDGIAYEDVIDYLLARARCKHIYVVQMKDRDYEWPIAALNFEDSSYHIIPAMSRNDGIGFPAIGAMLDRNKLLPEFDKLLPCRSYRWPNQALRGMVGNSTRFLPYAFCRELFNVSKDDGIMLYYYNSGLHHWFLNKGETLESVLVEMDLASKGER